MIRKGFTKRKSERKTSESVHISSLLVLQIDNSHSDEPLRGPVQEFDFDSDEEDDAQSLPSQAKKSKQFERPVKIIPTASDASDSDDSNEDENIRVTMANMEARSRALDETAAADAELDAEELRQAAVEAEDEDDDMNDDLEVDGEFRLPTPAERDEEKHKEDRMSKRYNSE